MLNFNNDQQSFRSQLPRNLIAKIISFLVNILIGVFLVPYYIDYLGVSSYALVPLATSTNSYVSLVVQSLNSSVSRYLTIDLQRGNFNKANITFNTSLFGMLGICFLFLPVIIAVSYYTPAFFEIPPSQKFDAFLLFLGVMIAFLISTLGGVFGVSLFAYNRLDLQSNLDISNLVIKVGVIVLLFSKYDPKLSHIGLATLIASIVCFIMTVHFSKKVNPNFKVNLSDFRFSEMMEITKTGKWLIVNQVGSILFLQMDLIVVNKLFGSIAGGEYAAVMTWSKLLRTIGSLLAGVLIPIIFTYYAKKQFDKVIDISKSSVKLMGFAIALPLGCLCGFSPNILSIWLGPEFARLSLLMWILLSHLIINLSILPLFSINVAFNKVRIPGIVTLIMGIGNFLLAITFSQFTGLGYYGVALAGSIMFTLKNSFFIPLYAAKVLQVPKYTFLSSLLYGIVPMSVITGVILLFNRFLNISTITSLIFYCGIVGIAYFSVLWIIGLTPPEKKIICSFLPVTIKGRFKLETDSN